MVFSSSSFLFLFFPAALIGYYLLSLVCRRLTNLYLFLASMVFYCWSGPRYAPLLLFSIASNYAFALLLGRASGRRTRRLLLALALSVNLGMLGYYKYSNFFLENVFRLAGRDWTAREIVLPVGISFYTFQAMSYVIDVFRGAQPIVNPADLGTYITFFPQLIAGPIVRYGEIRDYLRNRVVRADDFFDGMARFLTGLCKKVILANHLGALADTVFGSRAGGRSVLMLWLAAIAYSMQIYFDFSGYSDMAIGLGRLFGFVFPENFNHPYAASSVTDFWRRWHMTLSGWFRDYVYIPLGGSRRGRARHVLNLFLVWLLTGLWHGAAWKYVVWGVVWFLLLAAEKYLIRPGRIRSRAVRRFYRLPVLICVCLMWVLFRAKDLSFAGLFVTGMFGLRGLPPADASALFLLREYAFFLAAGLLFSLPLVPFAGRRFPAALSVLRPVFLLLGAVLSVSFILKEAYNPFLYFQF